MNNNSDRRRFSLVAVLALLVALALPAGAGAVTGAPAPDSTYVTNGTVGAVVHDGSTTYIGGTFTQVGPRTGSGVGISTASGSDTGLPQVSGGNAIVFAVQDDGAGGWFVGGSFTHVGGVARANIAHILADKTVDPAFDPAAAGNGVYALAVSGGMLYAGGNFISIGGQPRKNIAALDATTGAATSFNPSPNNTVSALAVSGGSVYAGGAFTSIGGQARNYVAALDVFTGAATSFNPSASSNVMSLAVSGGTVYAGGIFTAIGGQPRNRLAALDATTGVATSFNPNASSTVRALAVSGGTLYVGGDFTSIGGQSRNRLAALNSASGIATSFNPNANGNVFTLAVSGGAVYAGGAFTTIGGQTRNHLAAIDTSTGAATSFNPNANGDVAGLAVSGGTLYAGGYFSSIGGQTRNRVAALDSSGALTAFDPNVSGTVRALAVSGGTVYVGGDFLSVGGQTRNYIVAVDSSGAPTSTNFNANGAVYSLTASAGTVYVGGNFTSIGGQARNRLAALDSATGTTTSFDPSANGLVRALTVSGGAVYAGGDFTAIGGQTRNRAAALDSATGIATPFNPNANSAVLSLAVTGGTVYAGGAFTSIGGQSRNYIAALDASGAATSFNPSANGIVYALAVSGGTVYAGGVFTYIGGQYRLYLGAVDSTGTATSFEPRPNSSVFAMAFSGRTLYTGGNATTFELAAQQGFAQFTFADTTDPSVSIATPADGATYAQGATVDADFSCADETGGSGVKSCDGTAASGSPIDTSLGAHDFTVTATDNAGNSFEKSVSYTVTDQTDPSASIATPADGATYAQGATGDADFSCADETGGSGVASCVGTVADGSPVDTSLGTHDFKVTATDNAGNSFDQTVSYTVTDQTKPDAPTGLSTVPGSPGQSSTPSVKGSAEAGSTVSVYASSDCSGSAVAQGSEANFSDPGLTVGAVADGSTTSFYANATDAAGNTSGCSADHASYEQKSSTPPAPDTTAPTVMVSTTPGKPLAAHGGYFNAADLKAAGGKIVVLVSASDPSHVSNVSCTDNGQSVVVSGQRGSDPRTGSFALSSEGIHQVSCRATDGALRPNTGAVAGSRASATVKIDTTAPVAQTLPLPVFQTERALMVRWSAADAGSGVGSFDVRRRWAAMNSRTFGGYGMFRGHVGSTGARYGGMPGSTACFSTRARDKAGNVSAYDVERCAAVPLGDRALRRGGRWVRIRHYGRYSGTLVKSTTTGSTLTSPLLAADRLALLVSTGAQGGTIKVSWHGHTKTISLRSAHTHYRHLIDLAGFSGKGRLAIRVSGRGTTAIDGLGAWRRP